jgi:hypothetical protein
MPKVGCYVRRVPEPAGDAVGNTTAIHVAAATGTPSARAASWV